MSLVVVTLVTPAFEGDACGRQAPGCAGGEQTKKHYVSSVKTRCPPRLLIRGFLVRVQDEALTKDPVFPEENE
jgi:hypothetical protein